jgi:hypothetical protein
MPTVKISELPEITHYSTNTEATLVVGVDLSTGTTGKSTLATLGEGLYAYQPLKVGENQVLFSNTIGQFSGNSVTFLQINNQNFNANGSSDYVASASDSDNTNKYIDMGINGSLFSDPTYTSMRPYDGYVYVRGPTDASTTGNLVIGTASSFANIVYIVGGTVTNNIVARMTKTDLQLSAGYNIKFGDGSIQSVAASPVNYSQAAFTLANNTSVLSQAAFNVANTSSANTFITQGVDVTQNTRLTIIEGTDVSQNARTLIIEGVDSTQNNRISAIEGANFSQNNRMIIIEGTDTTQNTRLTVIEGTDATQNTRLTDIENVNLSQNTAISATDGKMQNSYNAANNAFVKANNALANTTGTFAGDLTVTGNVTIIGTVAPTKGFIYTPNIYPNAQTAVTISFANDSVVRAQTSAGLVVTLSSFVVGKSVEAWITNTAGTNQTFTHGCSAINSTVNSTTHTIPGTSTIFVKYWCIDGTLANTFVAIT